MMLKFLQDWQLVMVVPYLDKFKIIFCIPFKFHICIVTCSTLVDSLSIAQLLPRSMKPLLMNSGELSLILFDFLGKIKMFSPHIRIFPWCVYFATGTFWIPQFIVFDCFNLLLIKICLQNTHPQKRMHKCSSGLCYIYIKYFVFSIIFQRRRLKKNNINSSFNIYNCQT